VLLEGADRSTLSRSSFDVTIGQAYDTLGLDASSTTPDEARSRFRELIRSNHPDGKPSHEQARANETTRVIVEACTLLRTRGFPLVVVCGPTATASGSRYERQAAPEPESADPLAWLDDVWGECVRSNLVCVMSPAFGVRFALGAWTMGWETMFGKRSKLK
jgi:hypothetical protein